MISRIATSSFRLSRMCSHLAATQTSLPCREIRIPVPWGHIAAKEWGHRDGQKILGIHGWLDNCGSFDPIAQLLPPEYHFIAVDLPGHGHSSQKSKGLFYNCADFWVDVHRIIEYLQWRKFSFLAHSFGCGIAFGYAGIHPERVERVIALDGSRFVCQPVENAANHMHENVMKMLELEDAMNLAPRSIQAEEALKLLLNSAKDSLTEESAKLMLKRGSQELPDGRLIFTRDPRVKLLSLIDVTQEQTLALFGNISCEILLVEATNGVLRRAVPHEDVEQLIGIFKQRAERFEHVFVEGTHHVHMNNPDIVAHQINKFLNDN